MGAISLRQVEKQYGTGAKAVKVIHGVDAEIADGEFVVIVGPSGCGKSTLLRMVAGLEEITGGEIAIGARVVNQLEPAERDIAMVFQNYALYPHMSVYDNMAYGLKIAKVPKAEIEQRVQKAARSPAGADVSPPGDRRGSAGRAADGVGRRASDSAGAPWPSSRNTVDSILSLRADSSSVSWSISADSSSTTSWCRERFSSSLARTEASDLACPESPV